MFTFQGVGIAAATSGEIDFQFPEIALGKPSSEKGCLATPYGYPRDKMRRFSTAGRSSLSKVRLSTAVS